MTRIYILICLATISLISINPLMAQKHNILDKKIGISLFAKYNFYDLVIKNKERDSEFYPSNFDPTIDVRVALHPVLGLGLNYSKNLKTFTTQLEEYYTNPYDPSEIVNYNASYYSAGIKLHVSLFKIPTNYGLSFFVGFDQIFVDLENVKDDSDIISRKYKVINLGFDDRKFFNTNIPLYFYYGFEFNIHLDEFENDGFFESTLFTRTVFNGTFGIGYLI